MRKHSRKRKLSQADIGKCHPRFRGTLKKSCLPESKYKTLRESPATSACNAIDEHCILDRATTISSIEKEKLRKTYLRPRYPKAWKNDPDDWLDNYNIQDVMSQYQEAYPSFHFLGVVPIDFAVRNPYIKGKEECLHKELCELDLYAEYDRGIRSIGIIFNLDPHYKGGSHWIALYCDIHDLKSSKSSKKRPWCAYFDSYGFSTPEYIAKFMRSLYSQNNRMHLMFNARRFQHSTSECGMYSMYFIICMINGIPFSEFCKNSISDATMLKMRKLFFTE